MLTPTELKAMVTVPQVLELLGVPVSSSGKFRLREDDDTPSVQAYATRAYDFGTGVSYDVIALVRHFTGMTFSAALGALSHITASGGGLPTTVALVPTAPAVVHDFTSELARFPLVGETSLGSSFIDLAPPAACRADDDGNLLIPHARDGVVYGVKVRTAGRRKSAWPGSCFTLHVYRTSDVGVPKRHAVLVEGESDLWALERLGWADSVDLFALPAGAGAWKESWLSEPDGYESVTLIFDNDSAGRQARDKLRTKIGYARLREAFVPGLYRDIRDAVTAGWRPDPPPSERLWELVVGVTLTPDVVALSRLH